MNKRVIINLIVLALAAALLPSSARGYVNSMEISLDAGTGTLDIPAQGEGDLTALRYNLGYTRFLEALVTDDSPYGAREFLQHPSSLSLVIEGSDMSAEDKDSPATLDNTSTTFSVGGQYFIDNGDMDTGIGLKLASFSQDYKLNGYFGGGDTETTATIFTLSVEQYLSRTVSVGLEYESGDYEEEDKLPPYGTTDEDITTYTLSAKALIDNLWLEGGLWTETRETPNQTDIDVDGMGIEVGYYLSQTTAVFLHMESQKLERGTMEQDDLTIALGGDFYLSESTHLQAALTNVNLETTNASVPTMEIDSTGLSLLLGMYF